MSKYNIPARILKCAVMLLLAAVFSNQAFSATAHVAEIGKMVEVGDVIFLDVKPIPFKKISEATMSWTNHVGIVVDVSGNEPIVAESTFPFSKKTSWSKFVRRSENGRVAVYRMQQPLKEDQRAALLKAVEKRLNIHYDTGFDLHSKGQFCSRFVHEVVAESTGTELGEVETFRTIFKNNPKAGLAFWRAWYFGSVPWERQTVTPASVLRSRHLKPVFDGSVTFGDIKSVAESAL